MYHIMLNTFLLHFMNTIGLKCSFERVSRQWHLMTMFFINSKYLKKVVIVYKNRNKISNHWYYSISNNKLYLKHYIKYLK